MNGMTETALELLKARLGITSTVRDTYLQAIVQGIVSELQDEKNITIDAANAYQLMFIVDYAAWRYMARDEAGGMPRHLQFRLHNLVIHSGGGANETTE